MSTTTLLLVLDIVGIAVFAVAGALTGIEKKLDIFGIIFLAGVTALGGGFIRDVLLGAAPVAGLEDWRYIVTPAGVGLVVFYVHPAVSKLRRALLLVDAAGMGLFAVAGARKAIDFGLGPVGSCVIGMITAIGGGLLRDVLVREIPTILHREIYATAALLGAVLVVTGDRIEFNNVATAVIAITAAFTVRVLSVWRKWSAPTPRL